MLWINIKRIIKAGFVSFLRNGFVSLSTISVMTVTLFVVGALFFSGAVLDSSLIVLKDKVDINVYFLPTTQETDILTMKKSIEALPEVKTVEYISRDAAIAAFKEAHQNDQATLAALDELNDNPLGAVLNIKAKEATQYEGIATFLSQNDASRDGGSLIDKINYYQNKPAIDKLSHFIETAGQLGLFLAIIFLAISFMITFNTIRLAIFIAKDEISVMKLVGASNMYVRGPFVIIGVIYGLAASLLTLIIFYPITFWLGPRTENFFTGMNIFQYYLSHFGSLFVILVGTGVLVGALSSYVAVRKYLQI